MARTKKNPLKYLRTKAVVSKAIIDNEGQTVFKKGEKVIVTPVKNQEKYKHHFWVVRPETKIHVAHESSFAMLMAHRNCVKLQEPLNCTEWLESEGYEW